MAIEDFPIARTDFAKGNGLSRDELEFHTDGPSMARQEFAEECDINSIMARYETTGQLPANGGAEPRYVDFTEIPQDLMGTLNFMDEAQASFMTLPAKVRREFDNNPHEFVAFASDPGNLGQLQDWGLAPKPEPEPLREVPRAPSAPPPSMNGAPGASAAPPMGGSAPAQ